jgi:hypothetical protein
MRSAWARSTGRGPQHARDDLDQRRLAGAVVADQADDLVGADLEVDVAERDHVAERHLDALHPDRMRVAALCHGLDSPIAWFVRSSARPRMVHDGRDEQGGGADR